MHTRRLTLAATCAAALLAASLTGCGTSASAGEGGVSAAALLARTRSCDRISRGTYRTDEEKPPSVAVCGAKGAVFWTADLDVDCDGLRTSRCNEHTDPWYQDDTAFHQSDGRPLQADRLPYIVVPGASAIWDYRGARLRGGEVVAVVHDGRVEYAVVGDLGPKEIIGEASYAAARALGIDPDPARGGTDKAVTYVVFTGSRATPIESHGAARAVGERLARQFVAAD
ncbi:glycoside hydrolase family 75 protein [Streptomyces actuosus]|uniref:Glycoside hydrolase family 75 protein n=1 Tax=Streptomyces actuosus TaxID=1885 RepID=A0ABS2VN24_STRAS|nr:glycoside hydrolase family 75 protein [Streptomyces actuosus]MBN0044465.1 glycoside hydrolase family 75 protein [Streptomyces actuosus]